MNCRDRHTLLAWRWLVSLCVVGMFLASSCGGSRSGDVRISRFERVLFDTPDAVLVDSLARFKKEHPTPLMRIYPNDEVYMGYVFDFRADSVVRMIDDTVRNRLGDLSWLEHDLSKALRRASKMDSAIVYSDIITYIGGAGYASRVAADRYSHSLTISIDEYVAPQMARYGYFGEPMYIVRLCYPEYIVADCMAEIARQHIALPQGEMTMLDYMVAEGKVQYFLHEVLPNVHDTILLRYTPQQLDWMEDNEANVWGYFVQQKLLYEHDYSRLRNFIEDAPKTNAFQESAPRTAGYIGWRIVSRYAKNKHLSLHELMEDTDAQNILYESGYRP
ncbi:MAG: hypothetical protein IJU90_09305 [Bacteroidales bacterium]|nr:hypothetical protein [Bacteroidales bacterium]